MMKVNYKSDFDVSLSLKNCQEKAVPFPECDWEIRFYTASKASAYVASCIGGEYVNCYRDNDRIHFVFDNHRLGKGILKWEPHFKFPNDIYNDRIQDVFGESVLDIELVSGNGDFECLSDIEVEVIPPFLNLRYEDLTEAEKEELQRPALEAASEAHRAAAEAIQAARQADSAADSAAEIETAISNAEAMREDAEQARVRAEQERATEFESWQTGIEGKADRTELSNILGNETEERIEDIEPGIVTEALRKVPQSLTPEEQDVVKKNIGMSKMELFCDLFSNAAGSYGYARMTDGEFDCELNGLTLTYDEAVAIYHQGTFDSRNSSGKNFTRRTNLPITASWGSGTIAESFNSDSFVMNVEVALLASKHSSSTRFAAYPVSIYDKPFGSKLVKIIGTIDFHFARAQINWFVNAVNLEEVQITRLAWSINLSSCSRLSLESFQYMIKEAYTNPESNHDRIITVHPDVYAKLTDESNTEWHKVLMDASAKNISFATV